MQEPIQLEGVDLTPDGVRGKEIRCPDGRVGQVVDVLVDPVTEHPSHLVWREAVVVTKEVSIPVDYVERVDGDQVVLRVKREVVERLPRFWNAHPGGAAHGSTVEGY